MKIENLKKGQVFKNYKSLCQALEIEVKASSRSKLYQFTELTRFCMFSRAGHRFIINEIYDVPKIRNEQRGKSEGSRNNNNIYGNAIQLMITDLLAQSKGHVSISRSRLQLIIGMTNQNYSELGEYIKQLAKFTGIDMHVLYDFYNTNNGNFKRNIEAALDTLQDKSIILYTTVFKVGDRGVRTAESDEVDLILECQKDVLEEMGYDTLSSVKMRDRKKFRTKTQKLLRKKSDLEFYYKAYDIRINKKYIDKERNKLEDLLLEDIKRNECKGELNDTVIQNIVKNASRRHSNEVSKGGWGTARSKKLEVRRSDTYIDDIKRLANILIDLENVNVVEQVKELKLDTLPQDLLNEIEMIQLFG